MVGRFTEVLLYTVFDLYLLASEKGDPGKPHVMCVHKHILHEHVWPTAMLKSETKTSQLLK